MSWETRPRSETRTRITRPPSQVQGRLEIEWDHIGETSKSDLSCECHGPLGIFAEVNKIESLALRGQMCQISKPKVVSHRFRFAAKSSRFLPTQCHTGAFITILSDKRSQKSHRHGFPGSPFRPRGLIQIIHAK